MSCSDRCLRYLKRKPNEWVAKGQICKVAEANSTYIGETIGRALRKLAEQGQLEVKTEKGHAYYRWTGEDERKRLACIKYFDEYQKAKS